MIANPRCSCHVPPISLIPSSRGGRAHNATLRTRFIERKWLVLQAIEGTIGLSLILSIGARWPHTSCQVFVGVVEKETP